MSGHGKTGRTDPAPSHLQALPRPRGRGSWLRLALAAFPGSGGSGLRGPVTDSHAVLRVPTGTAGPSPTQGAGPASCGRVDEAGHEPRSSSCSCGLLEAPRVRRRLSEWVLPWHPWTGWLELGHIT